MRWSVVVMVAVLFGCGASEQQPLGAGSSAKGDDNRCAVGQPRASLVNNAELYPNSPPNDFPCMDLLDQKCCSGAIIKEPEAATGVHYVGPPSEWETTVVGEVRKFQQHPQSQKKLRELAPVSVTPQSISFVQTAAVPGNEAAVEITRVLIPRAFSEVVEKLPPELWGYQNLAHWIGGERVVVKVDDQGRAVQQYERMVLTPFPCGLDWDHFYNDMTKAEVIDYDDTPGEETATVYWRVYSSYNSTVDQDYGSVEFRNVGNGTQITFHSAHRLLSGSILKAPIPPKLVHGFGVLKMMFTDFINHYVEIVNADVYADWP